MKPASALLAAFAACLLAPGAAAQTEGRYLIVATASGVRPFDRDVAPHVFPAGFVARVPKQGFRPTFGLGWFSTSLREGGGNLELATLRVRPLMAGVNYTAIAGRLAISTSVVAGYSFNSAEPKPLASGVAPNTASSFDQLVFETRNSFAARPGLSLILALDKHWVLFAGGGVLFVDPDVRLTRLLQGRVVSTETGTWKANSFVWGVGVGRSIF